jgi:hypothetical protein
MVTWKEFATARSDLAEIGKRMIYQFGPGIGYLATVRKDGSARKEQLTGELRWR